MNIILPVLFVFILLSLGAGLAIWYVFRKQSKENSTSVNKETQAPEELALQFSFKWRYVIVPVIILLASTIAVIFFYRSLPASLAYHFTEDGSGDRWLSREWFTVIMLLCQFILTCVGAATALIVAKVGQWSGIAGAIPVKAFPDVITVMSNMVVLPQLILSFAMLDVFSYNAYQIHLFSVFIFAILVMVVGGLLLAFLFFRAIRKTRVARGNHQGFTG